MAEKRCKALAILVLLQAPLFTWHALITLIANPTLEVTPVAQIAISLIADSLATALVVTLSIFVWRGASIAVGVSVGGSAIELVLAAFTLALFSYLVGTPSLFPVLLALQPLMTLGALAIPTLILGRSVLAAENRES